MLGVISSPDIQRRQEQSLPASPSVTSASLTSVSLKSDSATHSSASSSNSSTIASSTVTRSSVGPKPVKPFSIQMSPDTVGLSPNVFAPVTSSAVLTSDVTSPEYSRPLAVTDTDLASIGANALSVNTSQSQAVFSLALGPLSVAGLVNAQTSASVVGLSEPVFNPQSSSQSAEGSESHPIFNDIYATPVTNTDSNVATDTQATPTAGDASGKPSDKPESVAQNIFAKEPPAPEEKVTGSIFEPSDISKKAFEEQGSDSNAVVEQQILAELSKRDAQVKAHEQAHSSVGGNLAQSPQFSYEQGSDGKRYAVDGEVSIDISIVPGDPQATINKMRQVYAAAMAPANPSMADIRVAADAIRKMNQAQSELAEKRQSEVMSIKDMAPLIDAQTIIDGFTPPEPPEMTIAGEVDDTGAIRRPQPEEDNVVNQTIETINGQLTASSEPVFELLTSKDQIEGYLTKTLLEKYLPVNNASGSLSFSV
ncbi:SrpA-related protein [Shewanella sediminis HAW-EB3]|uniref:SrpA-related protein n=1 Tax=Shewanella sediminis (strain HAW-EB3) TaxID=425104 RepID=A8FUV6_SHESH|nr:putative metalloprotease CJM1_0395 family protein [Shewanella sediminis]ABV36629.1 SrpA-related protein [Shewanella sediminis HAW-EB3]